MYCQESPRSSHPRASCFSCLSSFWVPSTQNVCFLSPSLHSRDHLTFTMAHWFNLPLDGMDSSSRWWQSNALTKLDCQVPQPEVPSRTFCLLSRAHTHMGSWREGGNYSFSLPNGLERSSVAVKFMFSSLNL